MQRGHFNQIEGLRGYLALWVAVAHGLQLAGFLSLPGPLGLLMRGDAAVAVFIILSGFVITHLLMRGGETYPQYITRRWFRLFPAYAVACVISYLMLPAWAHLVENMPWQALPGWGEYAASVQAIEHQSRDNTLPHAALHFAMLHGVVPAELLDRAAMTFLPAAWSLSLEWQFYLIAPAVLAFVSHSARNAALAVLACIVLYVAYAKGLLGTYQIPSVLFAASDYFAVGIATRLGYERMQALRLSPVLVTVGALSLMVFLRADHLPISIWIAFVSFMLWGREAPVFGRLFALAFGSAVPLFVGSLSYPLYLIHRPIQVWLASSVLDIASASRVEVLATQLAAVALAVPAAYLLHRLVELPGMELGRQASAAIGRRKAGSVA